jgi:hypothetical protein
MKIFFFVVIGVISGIVIGMVIIAHYLLPSSDIDLISIVIKALSKVTN